MASQDHIRNPIEWGWDQISLAALTVGSLGRSLRGSEESQRAPLPAVARIKTADLREALMRGLEDFEASPLPARSGPPCAPRSWPRFFRAGAASAPAFFGKPSMRVQE